MANDEAEGPGISKGWIFCNQRLWYPVKVFGCTAAVLAAEKIEARRQHFTARIYACFAWGKKACTGILSVDFLAPDKGVAGVGAIGSNRLVGAS